MGAGWVSGRRDFSLLPFLSRGRSTLAKRRSLSTPVRGVVGHCINEKTLEDQVRVHLAECLDPPVDQALAELCCQTIRLATSGGSEKNCSSSRRNDLSRNVRGSRPRADWRISVDRMALRQPGTRGARLVPLSSVFSSCQACGTTVAKKRWGYDMNFLSRMW